MERLHHISLNTAHLAVRSLLDIGRNNFHELRPLVRNGGGTIAGIPFMVDQRDHGTIFALRPSGLVAVAGVVCWSEKHSPDAWLAALALHAAAGYETMPEFAPPIPWLAVSRDSEGLTELNVETMGMLDDIEHCLASAIIAERAHPHI
jgi:hypothetical protein